MVGFVHPDKVVVIKSAFSSFPSSRNGDESKDRAKIGVLKHQNRINYENGRRGKKKSKINLILLDVNHTFLILDLQYIGHGISNVFKKI
jgi:hypothetical protein